MPVQTDKSSKIKSVCDRLACLLSTCAEIEFDERVNLLNNLCKDWSPTDQNGFSRLSSNVVPAAFNPVNLTADGGLCTNSNDDADDISESITCFGNDDKAGSVHQTVVKQESGEERSIWPCGCKESELGNIQCKQSSHSSECVSFKHCVRVSGHTLSHDSVCTNISHEEVERPYVCYECLKRFPSPRELLEHLDCHTANANNRHFGFLCVTCRASFSSYEELGDHAATEHKVAQSYTCRNCSKHFASDHAVKKHLRVCNRISKVVSSCFAELDGSNSTELKLRQDGPVICRHRNQQFPAHDKEQFYSAHECRRCLQQFEVLSQLQQHVCSGIDAATHGISESAVVSPGPPESRDGVRSVGNVMDCNERGRRKHRNRPLPYACVQCERRFPFASDLRKHERRHTGQRPHVCDQCNKGFLHLVDLKAHSRIHTGEGPLMCQVCNRFMSSATALRAHMKIHGPEASANECKTCGKRFAYPSSFRAHIKRHDAAKENRQSSLGRSHGIDGDEGAHETQAVPPRVAHEEGANVPETGEVASHSSNAARTRKPSSVSITSSGTADSDADNCHSDDSSVNSPDFVSAPSVNGQTVKSEPNDGEITRRSNRSLDAGPMSINASMMQKWQRKYPGRKIVPHTCSTCGQQFLQAVQLRKHMIKHAEEHARSSSSSNVGDATEFPYTCCVCRRHFLFANDLKRHLISHSDDRPHSCVVCRRPFKREDDLAKHMKTHGDVRPYECDECGERLESATKLRKHARRAHGDKYECTVCRQYFAKRSLLSRHKREQHAAENDGSKPTDGESAAAPLPYMCDRCGRSFTYESDLRNHMYSSHSRRRTPLHSCTWCHRQFSSTSHLASHERTHTGDRPYTCDTCGKQFTQSGSLNVHRRTHVEPQPFACDICGQRFASKQYAKKHLAMRHGAAKSATNAS